MTKEEIEDKLVQIEDKIERGEELTKGETRIRGYHGTAGGCRACRTFNPIRAERKTWKITEEGAELID